MKITSFSPFKKTVLIVFCLTISTLFSACNKIPLFQDDDQNNSEDAGVVQTDWNNNSEIKVEPEPVPKKTSPLQPVSDQESVKKSREVSEQQEQQRAEFSVQIGAFLKKDNATRMVSKLKAKGYKPSLVVVETPGKRWHLVHVGSYAGKKTALSAAQKLTDTENMETAVVKNNAIIKMQTKSVRQAGKEVVRETSNLTTIASLKPERFTFQVGGLRTKENAATYKAILQKQGYAPYIKKMRSLHSAEIWYAVRIGHFETIEIATDVAAKFTAKEQIPTLAISTNE
ncbi:MAG: SPOR domain-containing protein [Deltaproteobacteria bacterium]|jgi:cell division protein FtsN|nr:SPOR domain-containing protein [Deltaproteobacteria bacterium]MBT4087376.1 SPOR domain-containing protein [Deltaproteobacteria bacterium]